MDWSKTGIRGLTLTLTAKHLTLLTNSLALFVTLAGGQLWTIIRFSLHQIRAQQSLTTKIHATAHYQQQVVLKNTMTDLGTAQYMAILFWRLRSARNTSKATCYAVLISILAVFHAALFLAAGAFSSTLTAAGSKVLSRSPFCGVWNETYYTLMDGGANGASKEIFALSAQFNAKYSDDIQLSIEYAQKCYLDAETYATSSTCDVLPKSTIEYSTTIGIDSCPFQNQICHDASEMMTFDTGLIDSHIDLGINSKIEDRLTYQRITSCAVLNDTGRMAGGNDTTFASGDAHQPLQDVAYMYYGPKLVEVSDCTYSYANPASIATNFTPQMTKPYSVNTQFFWNGDEDDYNSTFSPIPELRQESADTVLFFLSFVGNYIDVVDDPWFSAHRLHLEEVPTTLARTQFARDQAISTVGCTEQHQFCTSGGICTPFLGIYQVQNVTSFNSALTPHQSATFDRMIRAAADGSLEGIAGTAELDMPLLANNSTLTGRHTLSLALPTNQWQRELNLWHSIAMAQLQRRIIQWGTGQVSPDVQFLLPPTGEPDKWFCQNLMVPSSIYQSFSILALLLLATSGTLTILISVRIEKLAAFVRRACGWSLDPVTRWDEDDMLRLQERLNDRDLLRNPQPPTTDGRHFAAPPKAWATTTERTLAPPPYRKYCMPTVDMQSVRLHLGQPDGDWV